MPIHKIVDGFCGIALLFLSIIAIAGVVLEIVASVGKTNKPTLNTYIRLYIYTLVFVLMVVYSSC